MLDSAGFLGDPGAGGNTSSTSAASVGSGGAASVGSAGGQPVGSGGGGGNGGSGGNGSGGNGGSGGDTDAGCVGGEEVCAPWWDVGWTRRRRILVDLANTEPLIDYPVLVRLDGNRIDYAAAKPGGIDVRFLGEGSASPLSHEIEEWDTGSSSYVWVRLPVVQPIMNGPTVIWMYYDNDAAGPAGDSEATWNAGFRSVHHFNVTMNDSTAATKHGTSPNPPSPGPGLIAGAHVFDGMNDRVLLPGEEDFDFATMLSVSAWVRVASFTMTWQTIVAKGDDSWRLHREWDTNFPGIGTTHVNPPYDNFGGSISINDNTWHHVAAVYDGQTKKVFVDGALDTSKSFNAAIVNSTYPVCIGDNNQAPNREFHGSIDEVRISSVALPNAWMAADYRTVTVNDALDFSMDVAVPR